MQYGHLNKSLCCGCCATQNIEANIVVGFYAGELISKTVKSDYVLKSYTNYEIDSQEFGNITRFIQHLPEKIDLSLSKLSFYKDLFSEENILLANCRGANAICNNLAIMVIISSRKIEKDEMIGYSYGNEYWQKLNISPFIFNKEGEIIGHYTPNK